jgi:hypothetical protein
MTCLRNWKQTNSTGSQAGRGWVTFEFRHVRAPCDRLSCSEQARSTDAFSPCISLLVCSTGPTTRATVRSGASIPRVFPGEEDFGVPVGQDADSDPEADMKRCVMLSSHTFLCSYIVLRLRSFQIHRLLQHSWGQTT